MHPACSSNNSSPIFRSLLNNSKVHFLRDKAVNGSMGSIGVCVPVDAELAALLKVNDTQFIIHHRRTCQVKQ